MIEKPKPKLFGLSPATYGIGSVTVSCLAWASLWLILAKGPDFGPNHKLFEMFAIRCLPLLGLACGLLSVGVGIYHKNWLGIVAGAIGLGMIGFEAWLFLVVYLEAH